MEKALESARAEMSQLSEKLLRSQEGEKGQNSDFKSDFFILEVNLWIAFCRRKLKS